MQQRPLKRLGWGAVIYTFNGPIFDFVMLSRSEASPVREAAIFHSAYGLRC
jgi:hypothetical protein